jgi:hypothetical protein
MDGWVWVIGMLVLHFVLWGGLWEEGFGMLLRLRFPCWKLMIHDVSHLRDEITSWLFYNRARSLNNSRNTRDDLLCDGAV